MYSVPWKELPATEKKYSLDEEREWMMTQEEKTTVESFSC
jgi:hypothetical protein